MNQSQTIESPNQPKQLEESQMPIKNRDLGWRLSVLALATVSGFVTLWNLASGARSEYYASIAVSMSKNLSNFFFGAIDPAGTISLDKIPGSYWASATFVKLFGFSTWSVNAPNAIATIITVLLIASTVKNLYSPRAGLIAGALVAGVPVLAAVARSNQPESMFVLMLTLALWQGVKAFQLNSRKHLIFTGTWIAAAFQMYMIQAWAVWPALIIAWLFTEQKLLKKIVDLAIAGFTSLALSLAWIIMVWLTPASSRPYVGGTYSNSPWEMVFGYNAMGRFGGTTASSSNTAYKTFTPPFGGSANWDRLFNYQLSGQVSWLIPAAILAIVILFLLREKLPLTIFLAVWFITFAVMFSAVAGLHQFYVSALTVPMVALIAMAIEASRREHKNIFITIIVTISALWAIVVSALYSSYLSALPYVQLAVALATIVLLFWKGDFRKTPFARGILTVGIGGSLLLTPAVWAIDVINHPSAINPAAGPSSLQMSMGSKMSAPQGSINPPSNLPKMPDGDSARQPPPNGWSPNGARPAMQPPSGWHPTGNPMPSRNNAGLIAYLKAHRGTSKYLVATYGAQAAAPIITATGMNILPIGGFDGNDPAPTLEQFKRMVASGDVKYVLASGKDGKMSNGSKTTNSSEIQAWVAAHFITDAEYSGTDTLLIYSK